MRDATRRVNEEGVARCADAAGNGESRQGVRRVSIQLPRISSGRGDSPPRICHLRGRDCPRIPVRRHVFSKYYDNIYPRTVSRDRLTRLNGGRGRLVYIGPRYASSQRAIFSMVLREGKRNDRGTIRGDLRRGKKRWRGENAGCRGRRSQSCTFRRLHHLARNKPVSGNAC